VHTDAKVGPSHAEPFQPNTAGPPLKGPKGGFGPLAFSQGYNLPNQHGFDGTGRNSGVVIDADFVDTDLSGFLSDFNVTRTGPATTRIKIDGGPPGGDGSPDSLETSLDVETIVSNAPGTALYVYEFPSFNSLQYITDAYTQVVSDNIVDTANSSFGGCETGLGSAPQAWDKLAQQGAVKGITFHASTGDAGSNSCSGLGLQAPASGPHFSGIGGTTLVVDANGNYTSETGWNGSGGGVSVIFALPKFEKNVPNVITTGNTLPDVSFDANPGSGAALLWKGNWSVIGGTSLSSPIFGAATTEIDQVKSARYGQANKKIFKFWKTNGYNKGKRVYFHDITSGSNGHYTAGTGYDQVTGIGSMDVWNYVKAI
jgi:kumamolisin